MGGWRRGGSDPEHFYALTGPIACEKIQRFLQAQKRRDVLIVDECSMIDIMLQRNLIYTGITRAKKILVLVGTKRALGYTVRNVTVTKRNTMLKERLQKALSAC